MKIKFPKKNSLLILILLLAVLIRISFAFISYENNVMIRFSDDNAYIQYAASILEQGPLVLDIDKLSPTAKVVGPGLPWIMALVIKITSGGWLTIFIINAIIGSFTCFLIYLLGRRVFSERIGLFSVLWSVFYILFLKYVPTAGKEIWMTFLFTIIVWIFVQIFQGARILRGQYIFVMLLSFSFGLLIHIDERYFAYSPFFFVFLIIFDNKGWKQGLKKAVLFTVLVLLLMVPWLVRNYQVYKKPVIISVRTTPLTDKIFGIESDEYQISLSERWYLSKIQIRKVINGESVIREFAGPVNSKQVNAMKDGILPHKFSKLESIWSVFQILWKPIDFNRGYSTTGYRYDGVWSLKHNLSVGLTYGLLIPFSLWGLFLLVKEKRKIGIFLLSILLYHSLIHMLFIPFTRNRYHIPVDAILIVVGIYGMINTSDWFKSLYSYKKRKKIQNSN